MGRGCERCREVWGGGVRGVGRGCVRCREVWGGGVRGVGRCGEGVCEV